MRDGYTRRQDDVGAHAASGWHLAQKKTLRATERDRPLNQEKRRVYKQVVDELDHRRLIYIDEAGVNLAMTPMHAWAPVGKRAFAKRPGNRGSNVSVVAAVRLDGMGPWYPFDGAVNGERFLDYISRLLVPTLAEGDIVIMDNVRFHHRAEVREVIEEAGAKVIFLPPYSPELNPIEEVFSLVKNAIRRLEPRCIPSLVDALKHAFTLVTPEKLQGYFRHALHQPL